MTSVSEARVSREVQHEIEQFLYEEAALLDERRFAEWLGLLADDVHYWMPVRTARMPREEQREFEGPAGAAHFDDNRVQMGQRVKKLLTGRAWSEVPASRTRHLVTNVRATSATSEDGRETYAVSSFFLIYRTRSERYTDTFVGERRDVLRRAASPTGFEIARRTIIIDQTVILANNMSTFF